MTIDLLKKWTRSSLDLLFPPACAACGDVNHNYLCTSCASTLELIVKNERCPRCFSRDYCPKRRSCQACSKRKYSLPLTAMATAFENQTVVNSLLSQLKQGNQWFLADSIAAFLYLQIEELSWPKPDIIVPVPQSFVHSLQRRYKPSKLIARSLAKYFHATLWDGLSLPYLQLPRRYLDRKERQIEPRIYQRAGNTLEDKTVLLVDDYIKTGSTLIASAKACQECCPSDVYGISVSLWRTRVVSCS